MVQLTIFLIGTLLCFISVNSAPTPDEIIAVTGGLGSGVSTFVQIMITDNKLLRFVKEKNYIEQVGVNDTVIGNGRSIGRMTRIPYSPIPQNTSTGVKYCDLPAIDDENIKITSTYLNGAKRVKFVILIEFDSFKFKSDSVSSVLSNVAKLMGDVKKFKGSVVLVVNKFEDSFTFDAKNKKAVFSPDKDEKEKIVNRLRELQKETKTNTNKKSLDDLIDIILDTTSLKNIPDPAKIYLKKVKEDDWTYPRILFLRNAGFMLETAISERTLDKITIIQQDKRRIQAVVEDADNVKFTETGPNFFHSK